jgi:hypothetical protein
MHQSERLHGPESWIELFGTLAGVCRGYIRSDSVRNEESVFHDRYLDRSQSLEFFEGAVLDIALPAPISANPLHVWFAQCHRGPEPLPAEVGGVFSEYRSRPKTKKELAK